MSKMLLILFFLPPALHAQRREWDTAFTKSLFYGSGQRIDLPERGYNPWFDPGRAYAYRQKQRVFIISADSVYHRLFWEYRFTKDSLRSYAKDTNDWYYRWMVKHLRDSLPEIDFSVYDLILYAACAQCLVTCNHHSGEESCHRNACGFRESWFLRKKSDSLITWNQLL